MRIGLVIADFEMRFTTSFKHTARVKYDVDFTNSNITSIKEKLQELKEKVLTNQFKPVHVGYDFSIEDVEHVLGLLDRIVNTYKEKYTAPLPANKKLYTLFNQLRESETQTPKELSKKILKEILNPAPSKKLTRKEQIKADAEALNNLNALKTIKKISAKNKGKLNR